MVVNHLKMHLEYLKLSMKTALEYRMNFIIQIVTMIANDIVWVAFWFLFFLKFKSLEGWQMNDMYLLYAVITTSFGLTGIFFGNRINLSSIIVEGRLDYYLTLPKNVLYHTLVSKATWYDFGDVIFGLAMACIFVPIAKWPLFIMLTFFSAIVFLAFTIIVGSLAFFFQSSNQIGKDIIFSTISFSSYPMGIFKGKARILIFTVLPAAFLTGIPVELLKNFDIKWFCLLVGFTILISGLAIFIFYKGLKRYESGNLMYVRS